jgi:hypothetical protein
MNTLPQGPETAEWRSLSRCRAEGPDGGAYEQHCPVACGVSDLYSVPSFRVAGGKAVPSCARVVLWLAMYCTCIAFNESLG